MKNIFIAACSLLMLQTLPSSAQKPNATTKIDTISVAGTCGMCQKRIENAAYINGVKRADWDKNTKQLVVVYNSKKTNRNKIEQSIAKAGHDAGEAKADKEDYKKLPDCCAYGEVHTH
jgi:mercuric ion binding protein